MAIEIAERKSLQLVVGAHTEIICNPLSHALGVVVRDVGRERARQCDGHNHDRRRRRDLHFAAAGQYWLQDVSPATTGVCGCRQRYPERS